MRIERPDWNDFIMGTVPFDSRQLDGLDKWFDQNVEPVNRMLESGVEVYGDKDNTQGTWVMSEEDGDVNACESDTHKALLINITPIVKDTAESLLRDLINTWDAAEFDEAIDTLCINRKLYDRAKALLGEKE
jgi:hypothetical protein